MRALVSLLLIAGCSNPSILAPDPPSAERIGLGRPIDAQLAAATPRRYRLELAKDQVARGAVLQQGVDAIISVYDPSGKKLGEFDSHTGEQGPEPFTVLGSAAGPYDLEVRAWEGGSATGGKITTHIDEIIPRDNYEDGLLAAHVDSPRVRELFRSLRHHVPGAADAFWKSLAGHAPILEPYPGDATTALVTWVARSPAPYVGMVGGPDARENPMVRIADTDLFYLSARVPADARLEYAFLADAEPPSFHVPFVKDDRSPGRYAGDVPDPNNPRVDHGFSVFELPGAPAAPLAEMRAGVARGSLTEIHITSTALKEDRRVGIYTPPGYDAKQTYPLVIAFDGEVYGLPGQPAAVPVPTILDNLIADRKLPPVVAAIVARKGVRGRDLTYSDAFSDFIAGELVPRVRAEYHAGLTPANTLVTGSSLGGLASAFLALHHSDVVGNVLSNSGAYQIAPDRFIHDVPAYRDAERVTDDYVASPKLPIRFYLDCGVFEGDLRDSNRRMRDVLRAKGYDVTYREFSGDHDYGQWRRTIADGLIALLGQRS